MLSREQVHAAFVAVFGREPEGDATIEYHRRFPDLLALGASLRSSDEFLRVQRARELRTGRPLWVNVELPSGLRMWIDLEDDGVSMGCLAGNWEAAETELIMSLLSPGDVFLDIGANLGWFTTHAAQTVGGTGHVHAFEPRSTTFRALRRSVSENGFSERCTLWNLALGDSSGRSALAWSPSERNQGHTFLAQGSTLEAGLEGESVEMSRLDDLGLSATVRMMKIDVEGAEPGVLRGGMKLIERDLPVIVTEVFPRSLRQQGEDPDEFLRILSPLGYTTHRLTESGIGRRMLSCGSDANSPYYYFSVVMLSERDRSLRLNEHQDERVRDLERELEKFRIDALRSDFP